jgi:spore coat protein JA
MSQEKAWFPYVSPFDPCPAITVKTFSTPPNLYIEFQPMNWPQFPPQQALRMGTLWPALYSPYEPKP